MARLGGDMQVSPQELMTQSSIQMATLGSRATTGDGRVFRYVKVGGTALVPGKLYQGAAETTGWENLAAAVMAIGDLSFTITSTITATLNQMAGGFATITTSTGAGYTYKIKGNTAATGAVCTVYLEDPIQLASAAATTKIDIVESAFADVVISAGSGSGPTANLAGVAIYPVAATYYGWVQVGGPVGVLADGGITVGAVCVASNGTAGAVEIGTNASTEAQPYVGHALTGIDTAQYGMVYLNIS